MKYTGNQSLAPRVICIALNLDRCYIAEHSHIAPFSPENTSLVVGMDTDDRLLVLVVVRLMDL